MTLLAVAKLKKLINHAFFPVPCHPLPCPTSQASVASGDFRIIMHLNVWKVQC
jgi:hypothetical protein